MSTARPPFVPGNIEILLSDAFGVEFVGRVAGVQADVRGRECTSCEQLRRDTPVRRRRYPGTNDEKQNYLSLLHILESNV